MDRTCLAVLDRIGAHGKDKYEIISKGEFFECFPEETEKSGAALKDALKALIDGGFIDLKYSSGDMYCVCKLKDFLPPEPEEEIPGGEELYIEKQPTLPVFFAALAGSAAGSFIIGLIFAFI